MWQSEYFELLSQMREEEADQLKRKNLPSRFYKYRTLDEFAISSLENHEIWLNQADEFNDPYECFYYVNFNELCRSVFSQEQFLRTFENHYKRKLPVPDLHRIIASKEPYKVFFDTCRSLGLNFNYNFENHFQEIKKKLLHIVSDTKKNVRIGCFSTKKNSILMWSHYANLHKGICVEYDFSEDDEISKIIEPVYYTDKLNDVTMTVLETLNNQDPMQRKQSIALYFASITKAKDWAYEDEWRLLKNKNQIRFQKVPTPKAIYLGTRFNLNNDHFQKRLFDLCNKLNIQLYQMNLHDTDYSIIEDLHPNKE